MVNVSNISIEFSNPVIGRIEDYNTKAYCSVTLNDNIKINDIYAELRKGPEGQNAYRITYPQGIGFTVQLSEELENSIKINIIKAFQSARESVIKRIPKNSDSDFRPKKKFYRRKKNDPSARK